MIDLLVTIGGCAFSSILAIVIWFTGILLKQKAVTKQKGIAVIVGLSLMIGLTILFQISREIYIIVAILVLMMAFLWQIEKKISLPVIILLALLAIDFLLLRWGSPVNSPTSDITSVMFLIVLIWMIYYDHIGRRSKDKQLK